MKFSDLQKRYGITTNDDESTSTDTESTKKKMKFSDLERHHGISYDVNQDYINSFISEADNFLKSAEDEYNKVGWGNASDYYKSRNTKWQDLDAKESYIRGWLYSNKGKLDEETYKSISSALDGYKSGLSSTLKAFEDANNFYSQFETEDAYNKYKQELELAEKYKEYASSEEGIKGWNKYLEDEEKAKAYAASSWEDTIISGFSTANDNPFNQAFNTLVNYYRNDTSYARPQKDWTKEEQNIFGHLYLESPAKAYAFAEKTNNKKAQAKEDVKIKEIQDSATSDFWSGAGHTLGAILSAPSGLVDFFDDLAHVSAGRDIAPDGFISPFEYSQAVTGGITEHLNENYGTIDERVPVFGGKGLGDVYGLGTSIAQSAVSGLTLGSAGTLISYFGQGAAAGVDDALSRGASEEQAILYGTALGAFEGIAESIGIDNLFKLGSSSTIKGLLKNIVKQAGAEGLEESLTSVLSNIADAWIMQDKSNFNILLNQYMSEGMSESDAKWKVFWDSIEGIAYDTVGGFVSGGIHAGVFSGAKTALANHNAKKNYSGQVENLLTEAASIEDSGKAVDKYVNKYEKKGELSGWNINHLLEITDTNKVKSAVEAKLTSLGEKGDVSKLADILTKQAKGIELSKKEQKILDSSTYGKRMTNSLDPEKIKSGEYDTDWVKGIGTRALNASVYNKSAYDIVKEAILEAEASALEEETPIPSENTPQKEISTEGNFEAPVDAKITIERDGEKVEVKPNKIASIESGEMSIELEDGETVNVDEVDFGESGIGLVYQAAKDMSTRVGGFNVDTANVFVRGYTPGTQQSAAAYIQGWSDAYRFGKMGVPSSKLVGVINSGLSERAAYTAYALGSQNAENVETALNSVGNNGIINTNDSEVENESGESVHLRNGGKRDGGKNTQRQVSRMEGGTGQTKSRGKTARIADSEAARLVNEGREVKVSDLGILGGSKEQTVRLVDKANETSSMKEARKRAEARGLKVTFFIGDNLVIKDKNGEWISARAYIKGNHVFVRADHSLYTADQLMRHELGHDMIAKGEVDIQAVRERLEKTVGKEKIDEVAELYANAYEGTGMSAEEIWEECICDSLGDMNIFAGEEAIGAFFNLMLPEIKVVAEGDTKSPAQTRGSPQNTTKPKNATTANSEKIVSTVTKNNANISKTNSKPKNKKVEQTEKQIASETKKVVSLLKKAPRMVAGKLKGQTFVSDGIFMISVSDAVLSSVETELGKLTEVDFDRLGIGEVLNKTEAVTEIPTEYAFATNKITVVEIKAGKQKGYFNKKLVSKLDGKIFSLGKNKNGFSYLVATETDGELYGILLPMRMELKHLIDGKPTTLKSFANKTTETEGKASRETYSKHDKALYAAGVSFLHKNFPPENERLSEAHRLAVWWARNPNTETGDQTIIVMNDIRYLVECFDDALNYYQVEDVISKEEFDIIFKEIKQNGRSGQVKSVQGSTDFIDKLYKSIGSAKTGKPSVDSDKTRYRTKDSGVQRVGEGSLAGRERSSSNGSRDSQSSSEDRQKYSRELDTENTNSTEYKINTSMTMAEAKRMIETAYKVNNIAEYYEGEYANAEDWLKKAGPDEVEMYIENDFDLQEKYINSNEDILNEEYRISDVLDAYLAGTLIGKEKPKPKRLDISQSTKLKDNRFYSPQKIEDAKITFELASQKAVGKDANAINRARAEILLFAHNKGAAELLGVTQSDLNKKLRSWSNYSATARSISEKINAGVADENRWTGIENSAYINKAKVTNEDIERLVASVEGDSKGYERKYIARVMLAADTHIDYSGLKFKFASSQQVNADHGRGDRVLGFYDDTNRLIEVSYDKPNTVAHEMGHYIDAQWGRELVGSTGSHLSLTRGVNADMVRERYGEPGVQFLNNFKLFINSLSDVNQTYNSYYNDRGEIFARFFARFIEWTNNIATGNKYYSYESTMYGDKFTQAQFVEFARLLQEKALLDGSVISTKETINEKKKENVDVKYSERDISDDKQFNPEGKTLDEQLEDILHTTESFDGRYLYIGRFTSDFIDMVKPYVEMKNLPVAMNYRDAYLSMENKEHGKYKGDGINYHNLGKEGLKSAIESFGSPEQVLLSKKEGKVELVLQGVDKKGNKLLSIVALNTTARNAKKYIEAHIVTSIYGKSSINRYVNKAEQEGRLIYNKKEESTQVNSQVQYEGIINANSSVDSIAQDTEFVNRKFSDRDSSYLDAVNRGDMENIENTEVTFKGKPFWIAMVNRRTGNIEAVWTYEEAKSEGFDLNRYEDVMEEDGYVFFTTDLLQDNDRIEYDDYGDRLPEQLIEKINKQISVKKPTKETTLPERIRKLHDEIGTLNKRLTNVTQWIEGARDWLEQRANNQITFEEYESRLRKDNYYRELDDERISLQKDMDGLIRALEKAKGKPWKVLRSEVLYGVKPKNNDIRYSRELDLIDYINENADGEERKPLTNRSLLANALETAAQNDIEREKLRQYKEKIDLLNAEEQKLDELNEKIHELSFKKGPRDTEAIKSLQFEANQTANRINTYDRQLFNLESTKALKGVLEREKAQARKRAEEKANQRRKEDIARVKERAAKTERELMTRYQESRKRAIDRARETRDKNDAKTKLQKIVLETSKWLSYPAKDDVKCPDILREPYAKFLEGIDLSSKRLLEGGEPTHNDERVANAMNNLANAIERIKKAQDPSVDTDKVLDSGYLDLPVEFVDKLREMAENISKMMVGGDYVVNQMSSQDIKQITKLIRTLNHAIKEMSTLYSNLRFANVEELGDNSMTFLEAMGESKGENAISNFVGWDNALPYYAFKRFGEGGESIFTGLMDGQDKLANLAKLIFEFKDNTWTDKEAKTWGEDTHTISLPSGNSLTLTTANAMAVYCLSRRDQGLQHLLGGGTRVLGIKKGVKKTSDSRSTLTQDDVNAIVASLTDRQKKVALAIQKFMSETCAEWGNEVSMKRFLTKEFTDPNYFPIESNDENLSAKDPQAQQSDLYRLLNISATKPLTPGANNEVIIRNIFDVFIEHASDMAKLNAYGLPLLDYMKWVNYREKTVNDDGQIKVRGVHKAMTRAYGNKAWSYVLNLIKDVNGRHNDNSDNPFLMGMMRLQKTASVGNNLRVAFLQFTSYPRASLVLSTKSLVLGLTKKPQIEKAKKYCGIALWKSYGFYDTNIARSIEDQLKGATSIRQKLIELAMKGPEFADAITWGALWNACEYEVSKSTKNKVGSEEFYREVGLKLREVVYATQVVDSILTRSQIMRSKSGLTQTATAYMSEPTLTANILMNAGFQFQKEKRISGSAKTAWKKTRKIVVGAIGNYLVLQLITSLAESLADAWRDEDEEEFLEKFGEAFGENLITNLIPFNKIPIISDVADLLLSFFGIGFVSSDNLATLWITQTANAVKTWSEVLGEEFGGEDAKETPQTVYNAIYQTARAISSLTGVSVSGAMREVVALWNNTVGEYDTTLKIRQYDLTSNELGNELYEAIISGDKKQEESLRAMFDNEKAITSAIRKALRDNDPRIKEAAQARYDGNISEYTRIAKEIIGEGNFSQDTVVGAINSEISAIKNSVSTDTESNEDEDEATSIYKASDINDALESGDTALAKSIIDDLVKTKVANGKTEKEAKSSLRSSLTSYWKPLYKQAYNSGNASEMARIRKILYSSGLYGTADEVVKSTQAWLKD